VVRKILALLVTPLWASQALAQSAAPLTNDEASKEAENPVSRQITLPLRYQADFLDGVDHLTKSIFEVDQAIVPFRLNEDWRLSPVPSFRRRRCRQRRQAIRGPMG
jgi:hypothetical protein